MPIIEHQVQRPSAATGLVTARLRDLAVPFPLTRPWHRPQVQQLTRAANSIGQQAGAYNGHRSLDGPIQPIQVLVSRIARPGEAIG